MTLLRSRRILGRQAASAQGQKYLAHRERRCARSARRADEGIAALFRRGATQRCGMQPRSNAKGLLTLSTSAILLMALALPTGCYRLRGGGGLPEEIRTMYIQPFENSTPQFELGQQLF